MYIHWLEGNPTAEDYKINCISSFFESRANISDM